MAEQGEVNQMDQEEQPGEKEQVTAEMAGPPGGWTDTADADPQTAFTQQVADNSKGDAEKEAGMTFDKYLLVRHRHKVISGVIYLMDILTSDEDNGYAHVQVHLDTEQVLHLIAIKTGFTKDAPLDPLQEHTARAEGEEAPPPGGWTDVQDADLPTAFAQQVADISKSDAEEKAGRTFSQFLLVKHRHKVVSGVIYLLEIQINLEDDGYAHLEVYVDPQRVHHLQGIKTGFTKDASLDPLTEAQVKGSTKTSKRGCAIS